MTKTNGSNEMPWYVDPKVVSFFAISRFKIQAISNEYCTLTKMCQTSPITNEIVIKSLENWQ